MKYQHQKKQSYALRSLNSRISKRTVYIKMAIISYQLISFEAIAGLIGGLSYVYPKSYIILSPTYKGVITILYYNM